MPIAWRARQVREQAQIGAPQVVEQGQSREENHYGSEAMQYGKAGAAGVYSPPPIDYEDDAAASLTTRFTVWVGRFSALIQNV